MLAILVDSDFVLEAKGLEEVVAASDGLVHDAEVVYDEDEGDAVVAVTKERWDNIRLGIPMLGKVAN
jgi:choline kinase